MSDRWTHASLLCRLDDGTVEAFDRPVERAAFLGGRGYGVALVAEFGRPDASPLDPAQPLVLSAGPLTGTSAPSTGRFAVVAPSPLTGTIFDGNAGGRFGVRLRQAGVDALVLTGRAPGWSVLVVDGRRGEGGARPVYGADETIGDRPPGTTLDGDPRWAASAEADRRVARATLVPVERLLSGWDPLDPALTTGRVIELLRAALGGGFSLVFPSVAGRRGALLGGLRTDDRRTLGRGGLGAAMAAKRLFAVAVAGDGELPVADRERFDFLVYEAEKQVLANPVTSRALPEFGTAVLMQLVHHAGALPVLNYRATTWDGVDDICGEAVRERLVVGRRGCFGCRVRCTPRVPGGEGPEYETLWAFGADCGVRDLAAIQEANRLAGELGLDTISAGATIACAMELAESGVLARSLRFGDGARVVALVEEMGRGTGLGGELADGAARFAARYERPTTAMHVKGLEMPAYDPRGMHGQGLAYATSNRGACHLRGNMVGPEILGIPKLVDRFADRGASGILINLQHLSAVFDSACMCKFAGFAFGEEILARLLSAATGRDLGAQDLLRMGERIWTLERAWNLAAGFCRADDTLPDRVLQEAYADGPAAGRVIALPPMLDEYYRARAWDEQGRPRAEKLEALGLTDSVRRLSARGVPAGAPVPWQGWRPAMVDDDGCRAPGGGVAVGEQTTAGAPADGGSSDDGRSRGAGKGPRHLRAV